MNTMKQDQNDGRLTDLAKLESDIAAAMPEARAVTVDQGATGANRADAGLRRASRRRSARGSAQCRRPWCATMKPQPRKSRRWEPK